MTARKASVRKPGACEINRRGAEKFETLDFINTAEMKPVLSMIIRSVAEDSLCYLRHSEYQAQTI